MTSIEGLSNPFILEEFSRSNMLCYRIIEDITILNKLMYYKHHNKMSFKVALKANFFHFRTFSGHFRQYCQNPDLGQNFWAEWPRLRSRPNFLPGSTPAPAKILNPAPADIGDFHTF